MQWQWLRKGKGSNSTPKLDCTARRIQLGRVASGLEGLRTVSVQKRVLTEEEEEEEGVTERMSTHGKVNVMRE